MIKDVALVELRFLPYRSVPAGDHGRGKERAASNPRVDLIHRSHQRVGAFVDVHVAVHRFIKKPNKTAKRFVWTADPDPIIANRIRAF
ncbi:MAG: hypothetical protein OJJ55_04565 [Rhodococcus sp.]|nr:hypothetical protein [Rhodococcus sp. (in: high G+C Gram-positive bacteria)]